MGSARSWRSPINGGSSRPGDEELLQGAYLRLARAAAAMGEPRRAQQHAQRPAARGATTGAPQMLRSLAATSDSDRAVQHMMNMGMQHMQQQAANRFILQQQQNYQQGSSATAAASAAAATRRYSATAAPAAMMQQQQLNQTGRRMAPTPTPTHKHGMKDVPYWLKTLRLHKYTGMFSDMEYTQMMALDEKELEARGVTKGARRKILQSIAKLRQRAENVRRLEATFDMLEPACLRCAIVELRQLVATPIMPYAPPAAMGARVSEDEIDGVCAIDTIPDENLPALMVRLLMRVYAMGVAGDAPHEQIKPELLLMYFTICDRMLMNEAFTSSQKRRIVQWRRAARRFAAPADLRRCVLPHPPPPRCDACTPVSTFYFNDSLEEIMRVQNLQRLVKQYLNSDGSAPLMQQPVTPSYSSVFFEQQAAHAAAMQAATAAAARSQLQRDAALCGFSAAAAYAARPSALTRKMMPRGGPVSAPPASFYASTAPQQQQQHRCCPSAAAAAAYQQQIAAAAHRMAAANAAAAAAAVAAPAAAAAVPWSLEGVYSSADVFELARPLDLDFTAAPSRSIWSNTPASSQEGSSGYSSGSSERGSGAGSPRAADAAGASAPAVAVTTPAQPAMVFDFSRTEESSSLDATCRQIQEQLNFHH